MSATTVLLAGGPMDGELRAIADDSLFNHLAVAIHNENAWASYQGMDIYAQPTFDTKLYRPVKVALFGKRADRPVFVFEDADEAQVLAKHLLTPLARKLVGL